MKFPPVVLDKLGLKEILKYDKVAFIKGKT